MDELPKQLNSSDCPDCLCGASLISMMQSTDLWNLYDPLRLVRLDYPTFWCVLIQGQVRAGLVIVAEIIFEQSAQMVVIEDDHMIQALATNASDHPLDIAILPRTCCPCSAINRETVRSEISNPSFSNSPWGRGLPRWDWRRPWFGPCVSPNPRAGVLDLSTEIISTSIV